MCWKIKYLLNNKKVIGGVSKEYIVKNDQNKRIYWVVLLSNEENKRKQLPT